jgi:hypothetical protein
LECVVETSGGTKTSRSGDRHQRHVALDDQLSSEVKPVVVGNLLGSLTDLFFKKPPQVSCAHSQPGGKLIFVGVMKLVSRYEFECPLHYRFFSKPGR